MEGYAADDQHCPEDFGDGRYLREQLITRCGFHPATLLALRDTGRSGQRSELVESAGVGTFSRR
jgi:hypothetical protein